MNAAAPQAPVAAPGGKNRKAHHAGTPAALGRGPAKGSAAFQQMLQGARAARLAALAAAGRGAHAAHAGAASEADGLKKALADLLKGKAAGHRPGEVPLEDELLASKAKSHEDGSRKTAHAKGQPSPAAPGASAASLLVLAHAERQVGAPHAQKEAKTEPTDAVKAPVAESHGGAHRQEPLTRIVDLRKPQKQAASTDASTDRKAEPAQAPDRDPSGGIARATSPRTQFADSSPRPVSTPAATSQTPLERLRDMAGSELVRASTMVLRDGGGEIRLVLKPESLGSVRVRMNLVDNHIEGRIIVDSAAVKHVFDGSVDALRRALTAEGFQMGSLQVSVGGQDAQAGQDRREREPSEAVRKVAAQGFERSVPGAEDISLGDLFVNLFV